MLKILNFSVNSASIVFIVLLSACGGGSDSSIPANTVDAIDPTTIRFSQHLDVQEKISMIYPKTWSKEKVFTDPEILMAFVEPADSNTDKFLENILLIKVDNSSNITNNDVTNILEISSRQIDIAGFPAEEIIFDADVVGAEEFNLRFMQIVFEFNGFLYGLLYSAERNVFERNTEIVEYMAHRLNIGDIIFSDLEDTSDLSTPGKPAIATDGQNFLVISCRESEAQPYPSDLVGKIIRDDRSASNEFLVHSNIGSCGFASYNVAFDGNNYIVVYMTYHGGNRRVVGKRLTFMGGIIDNQPIDISQNPSNLAFEPTLVFDGDRTLVVWHESDIIDSIKTAFIDANANVTNSLTIEGNLGSTYSDTSIYTPQVAMGDNQFMVIWSPYFFEDTRRAPMPIFGQQIDLSGNLLLPSSIEIRSDNGKNPRYTQLASDGSNYLVGWIEGLLETNVIRSGSFAVYARQISSSGELLNGNAKDPGLEITPPLISTRFPANNKEVPKDFLNLSYNKGNYLFLWSSANYDPETGVYGVQVSDDLAYISQSTPIAGIDSDIYSGDIWQPTQANIAYSKTRSLTV